MTKQDYEKIAGILNDALRHCNAREANLIRDIAWRLRDLFKEDDPNFDQQEFEKAI